MSAKRMGLVVRLTMALAALTPWPAAAALCGTALNAISVSATAVDFGTYSAASGAADVANGTISIRCALLGIDVLPDFVIVLSTGGAGSYSPRQMTGASTLNYNLYTDAGYAVVWGDGAGGSATQSYSTLLLLGTVDFTVFGRIPTAQFVAAGVYSDTITVRVDY